MDDINFPVVPCNSNLGGLRTFKYITAGFVSAMDINHLAYVLNGLTLSAGKTFKDGYSTFERLLLDQPTAETVNGTIYKPELKGFCPGYDAAKETMFAMMAHRRFIIDVTDNNDKRYVLGTPDNGLRFAWSYSSQGQVKGLNGYSYRFYHESVNPRLAYNP